MKVNGMTVTLEIFFEMTVISFMTPLRIERTCAYVGVHIRRHQESGKEENPKYAMRGGLKLI